MSIALGQHTVKVDAFTGTTTTSALATTTGSTIVLFFAGTIASPTFSDNKGNTYSTPVIATYNGTFRTGAYCYCQNVTGGSGHTFTVAGGSNDSLILFAVELTGAATLGGEDKTTTPVSSSASPLVVQSITPNTSNTLVLNFGAVLNATSATNNAAGGSGGFTIVDSGEESSFGTGGIVSYKLVGTAAAVQDSYSVTDSSQYASFSYAFASGGPVSGNIAWITA